MKRSFSYWIVVICALVIPLSSCEKSDVKEPDLDRVILLYMAANNNLSSYAEYNLSALTQGYIPSDESRQILLVYQHLEGKSPKLVRMFKETDGTIKEEVVAQYDDHNSATGDVLRVVLGKIKAVFPSKEYGLILWSHATGWLPQGYYNSVQHAAFFEDPFKEIVKSFGEDRGIEMEIKELKDALPFRFSFIIFDCCLMGGVETLFELKDKADYIIASPTEILANGFPYRVVMEPLFKPRIQLDRACELFYQYYDSQFGVNKSATIALYKTDKVEQLSAVCKSIFDNHRGALESITTDGLQPYFRLNKRWYWDLSDFIHSIATPQEREQFDNALNQVVIGKWNTPNFLDIEINTFSGLSTYVQSPKNSYLDNFYKDFGWNVQTGMIK